MKHPLLFLFVLSLSANSLRAGELRIYPPEVQLVGPKSSQQLIVVLEEDQRVLGDQTKRAKYASSSPQVVTVDATGKLQVVGDGDAIITALVDNKQASTKVRVTQAKAAPKPSFRNDVIPILTRSGCNSGACHGALAGKGGLKLSLRGYDPDRDHFVLTRQAVARRVNSQEPEKSLFLTKATRQMAHGGGERFAEDSVEYQTLLDWIKSGSDAPQSNDPQLQRIDVFPKAALLKPKDTLHVIVRAYYSDGSSRDVTQRSRFGSSEDLVAGINESGIVTVNGHGEAAITIGYGTQVATIPITSPFANKIASEVFEKSPRSNFIDELVLRKLQLLNLPPSEQSNDFEFIRRIYLDLMGILPTSEEVNQFVKDTSKDKRARLIDRLLERSEFVDYWTYKWSDMLLVSTRKLPQQAMWSFYRSVRQSVADNKPWNQFARDLLTASGSTIQHGQGNFFVLHRDTAELSESVSITFMGMSIACAKCHNHPLEKWTQDQYWGMANLFSRVGLKNGDRDGEVIVHSLASGDILHPRHNIPMFPTPLDAKPLDANSPTDRREYFVDWLTAKENPYFAKAIVNRVWKNFMGRGLVEAEDDLRETNPPSNRELFDALAKDFVDHQYDVKYLIRLIANSAAYQRSSKPNKENISDDRFYSRYVIRRLSAEIILDTVSQVTDVPTPFTQVYTGVEGGTAATSNYPLGTRSLQLPDTQVASKFLDAFGRPERIATCSCERQQESSVSHALMLNNGAILNDKLRNSNSRISKWIEKKIPDEDAIRQVFLLALCRQPTSEEMKRFQQTLSEVPSTDGKQRREVFEDLFWAVLTSKEFMFNH